MKPSGPFRCGQKAVVAPPQNFVFYRTLFFNSTSTANAPRKHDAAAQNVTETSIVKRSLRVNCGEGATTARAKPVRAEFETFLSMLRVHVPSNITGFRMEMGVEASVSEFRAIWYPILE